MSGAAPTVAVPGRAHAGHTWRVLRSQVLVEQRMFWRNRSGVFFTFVFPLLLLGLLSVFADRQLLVPGIAALIVASTAFQMLCIQLAFHREQGVLKRLMAAPLPSWLLVAGKILSACIVVLIEVCCVALVGWLALDVPLPADLIQLALGLVLGVAAFASLAFAVASLLRNDDTAPAVTNAIQLPMLFVAGVFYPVSKLPEAAATVGMLTPLYHVVEPVRGAWHGSGGSYLDNYAALAAWTVLASAWALLRFRWSPAGEG